MKPDRLSEVLLYVVELLTDAGARPSAPSDYESRRRELSKRGPCINYAAYVASRVVTANHDRALVDVGFVVGVLWAHQIISLREAQLLMSDRPPGVVVFEVGDTVLHIDSRIPKKIIEVRPTGYSWKIDVSDGCPPVGQTDLTDDPFCTIGWGRVERPDDRAS